FLRDAPDDSDGHAQCGDCCLRTLRPQSDPVQEIDPVLEGLREFGADPTEDIVKL
ncbi:unnamed protein product, partial [Allacma fusca]